MVNSVGRRKERAIGFINCHKIMRMHRLPGGGGWGRGLWRSIVLLGAQLSFERHLCEHNQSRQGWKRMSAWFSPNLLLLCFVQILSPHTCFFMYVLMSVSHIWVVDARWVIHYGHYLSDCLSLTDNFNISNC